MNNGKIKNTSGMVELSDDDLERVFGGVGNTDELSPALLPLLASTPEK